MEKIDVVIKMLKSAQAENSRRFKQIEYRLDRIEHEIRADKDKLQAVYDSREKVKIEFGWQWSLVSFVLIVVGASVSRALPF